MTASSPSWQRGTNYYFQSDADINYKARTLVNKVYQDDINNAIYTSIIASYAKIGLHEKAANFAKTYIMGTLNRSKAYSYIGRNTAIYSKVDAVKYLQESEKILGTVFASGRIAAEVVNRYQTLVSYYVKAGEYEKQKELREFVINDLLGSLSESTTPKKSIIMGNLLTSQKVLWP